MAIISASRRTDIPAFHSQWFMDKIARGQAMVKNPFNGQTREVSLRLEDVDGIVFWSRDYRPMLDDCARLSDMGYRFYFQLTIIGYPRWVDPGSPPIEISARTAHALALRHGPRAVVWRYDPVMLAQGMDAEWHLKNFTRLADMMEGATDECVTSFIDFYAKFSKRLPRLMEENCSPIISPEPGELPTLISSMGAIAARRGIRLSACCETENIRGDIPASCCVDRERMAAVAGVDLLEIPKRPTRRLCGCHASVDIGAYDTCPAGCAYCYANRGQKLAVKNSGGITPENRGLWPQGRGA
ncbi:MAG: DUF1848 domain-containing protein [Nitrospinota bacterium]|nr:DUF1848 domain-containing protein [Nitrospinota bacterium]